jgi:hypothetical protein
MSRKRDASSSKLKSINIEAKSNYKYFDIIPLDDDSDIPNESKPRRNIRVKENDRDDSQSTDSSSESDSEILVDSNSDEEEEIKLKKLKKQLTKFKDNYKSVKHKLEKIDRALVKARNENNKTNVKKCNKYKLKYEQKLQKVKKNLKTTQAKLVELEENEEARRKENDLASKAKEIFEPNNAKDSAQIEKNKKADDSNSTQPTKSIKLPYPVLNDKRDMKTVLITLETKFNELKIKTDTNKRNISTLLNSSMNEINKTNLDKLRQLEQTYESQMDKLLRQIDYIKLSLHLETIRGRNLLSDGAIISSIAARLNEMYMFMKNENIMCLKKHALETSSSQQSTKPQQQSANKPDEADKPPTSQLNALFEVVNKSFAALLAHTAAAAHANAAVNAYSYAYYYQQQVELQGDTKFPEIVPLKTEIEKASNTFAKYKDKISSFFQTSKKLETTISKINKNQMSNLNKLMIDYSDNLSESDDEELDEAKEVERDKAVDNQKLFSLLKSIKESEINKPSEKENQSKQDEDADKEDDEDNIGEDDDDELEIITTSELKSQRIKPNYLIPSLKASYFPLKASLDTHFLNSSLSDKQANNSNLLIAVEKSKCALTFLGNSYNCLKANPKQQKLSDILYG